MPGKDQKPSPKPMVVTCLSCGHVANLPALAAPDVVLARLTKRFVCSVCGIAG